VNFPYPHDLDRLRSLIPEGWPIKEKLPNLPGLSLWAVEPRCPGDLPEATEKEAETSVEQAREILHMTLEDLKSHGYAPGEEEVRREAEEEE
jgi:hypothetical protein